MATEEHRCHDCGAREGELHGCGCDMERCPACGTQAITCHCIYKHAGLEPDWEKPMCGLPEDLYRNGPTQAMIDAWDVELDRMGRIPYIVYPSICARCGKLWPKGKMVPNWEWERYIEPEMRRAILCEGCYDEIRRLIDERASLPAPELVLCPECKGSGRWGRDNDPNAEDTPECPECRGTTKISPGQVAQWTERMQRLQQLRERIKNDDEEP